MANVIFSTDQLLDGIPKRLQRIEAFDQPGDVSFQKEAEHWFHAASCGTTWINLGKVLKEEDYMNIKWMTFVDDDTFVIRDNVPKYFSTLYSSKPQFLTLFSAEKLHWHPRKTAGSSLMNVGSTAAGVVYSKGLMDRVRADQQNLFSHPDVYTHCRRAKYADDVAISLLASVDYNLSVLDRPDLQGYHVHNLKSSKDVMPLTMHTQQRINSAQITHLIALAAEYYAGEKGH